MPRPLPIVLRPVDPAVLQLGCGTFNGSDSEQYSVTLDIDPRALQWLASVAVSRHAGTLEIELGGVIMRLQAEQL